MKIVHLSTFHRYGGAAIAALRIHQALLKTGIESSMLVHQTDQIDDHVFGWANNYFTKKVVLGRFALDRLYFLPYEKDKNIRFHFSPAWAGVDVSSHPLVQQADIINLHWINFGFLSISSLKKLISLGKPIVWTMHDMWTFTGGCHYSRGCTHFLSQCGNCPYLRQPAAKDLSYRIFEQKKYLFQNTNISLVSPSNWLTDLGKKAILTHHLISKTIHYPIDTQYFKPKDKTAAKIAIGLNPKKKWILFAGMNTQDVRKGFDYFKSAVHLLQAYHEDWGVVIFGKASNGVADILGLEVLSLGFVPAHEVVHVYQAAETMVVPSLEDNYPNTVLEAMACGTPVVGFSTGGIPEQITHQHDGYVAELCSAKDLSEGIMFVLHKDNYEKLSKNARHTITHRNDPSIIAAQYMAHYQLVSSI